MRVLREFLNSSRLLVLAFALAILIGFGLLCLPFVEAEGHESITPLEALFTSTSAICVTGLIVRDTGHDFSFTGQIIILILIQAGGLGILTFSNLMILLGRGRLSLRQRIIVEQTHGILPGVTPGGMVKRILVYTFLFESLGAVLLASRFYFGYGFGFPEACWQGIFHSVSAFCNAGFSLFTTSFMDYRGDYFLNFIIMILIMAGGFGMMVLADIHIFLRKKWLQHFRRPRLTLHSRVVLWTSLILIVAGALLVLFFEKEDTGYPARFDLKVLAGFFTSVTARTAGFNTTDFNLMSNAGLVLVILLMLIGGSPGSTAGGMKTTTLAAIFAHFRARAAGDSKPSLMGNSISSEIISKALTTLFGFFMVALIASVLLEWTEAGQVSVVSQRSLFLPRFFEVVSALCTVGLSTGITAELSGWGQIILIACMFIGRLGPVIIAASFIGVGKRREFSYPEGRILVG
ncbi:MAG: TrkH family potassium uptake protein [Candidatus Sumerlaeia bacterium]